MDLPFFLWLTFILSSSISRYDVSALIAKHCVTFEEHLLGDIGGTVPCSHHPGLGPYGECNIVDFQTDLQEVEPGIRSLCIYFLLAEVIPANAFSHLPTLEFLYITGNSLKRVQSGAFSQLSNLRYLSLLLDDRGCSSVAMDSTVFAGLSRLEELSLEGLRWTFMGVSNATFDPLLSLSKLSLNRICLQELAEVFCHLSNRMSYLKHLKVINSGITSIRNRMPGCPGSSKPWPSNVLAGVQTLDLRENEIKIIEANSLRVFQNLSSLTLSFYGVWLGSIWESGVGEVSEFELAGVVLNEYQTNFKDLCRLVSRLNLQSLVLTFVKVRKLSAEDVKDCGKGLKELSIFNSNIQELDLGFWTSILSTKVLHMTNTGLTTARFCDVANGTMELWMELKTLGLGNNQIKTVETNQFLCMPQLEQLLLNDNKIQILEPGAFRGLLQLKVLKLNSNSIKMLAADDFRSLWALEILLIDNNVIESIDHGTFRDQKELRELTFGRLEYVYTLHLSLLFYGFPEKMQRLSIDAHYGTTIYAGDAGRPNDSFVLELNGDVLNMGDLYSPFLESVRELKLSGTTFFFKCSFFVPYFSNLESLELLGNPERVHVNYSGISSLRQLKKLKLINLNFSNHTNPGMTFWNLKMLRILVLHDCHFSFLTKRMFRDLRSLQLLRLYSSSPLILHDGMFEVLPALRAVVFDLVEFRCDCENGWFLDWAESSKQVQVIHLQRQQCVWHYQKRDYLSTMEKLCQTDVQYLCYLCSSIAIALLLSASVGYRFAYWSCVVLFFRLRGYVERKLGKKRRIKRRRRERQGDGEVEVQVKVEEEEEMKFDAFVSFSRHDEAWVLGELAPRLEERGQPRLRLCLHSRDFEVKLLKVKFLIKTRTHLLMKLDHIFPDISSPLGLRKSLQKSESW
uniref:Toll-like receptor 19 n=1 Tax=Astyanax mexicanus TaxID=7994 RepID=A0A8B9HT59_ASTMX